MAVLIAAQGPNAGRQYSLDRDRSVLGRLPECDVFIDFGAVSREHAQILRLNDEWYVEDLKSRNATFVNGQKVLARQRLRDNDQLTICEFVFSFHLQPPSKVPVTDSEGGAVLVDDDATSAMAIDLTRSSMHVPVNPELKLRALVEITRSLASALEVDEVLPKVLDSLFRVFVQADRGFVVLWDPQRKTLVPKATKHRRGSDEMIRISRTIVTKAMAGKEAILSADAANDDRFDNSQSIADFRIRSMICAPLLKPDGEAIGVIQLDTLDQRHRFQADDVEVLMSVAAQAAVAVENAQLHEAALTQRSLARDLSVARQVQHGILPAEPPRVAGFEFFDYYESANVVGGDYYDYVPLPGDRLAVVLADVSGKGISAALLMAKLSSEVRYTLVSEPTPAEALSKLNANFFGRSGWEDRFVTAVVLVLDRNRSELTIANAGHMAPLLRLPNGKVQPLGDDITGVPLGVDLTARYEQTTVTLDPDHWLTVFTDGISEAMNEANSLYTIERLETVLASSTSGASELGGRILSDVKRFVGTRTQSDDMCLVCFGRSK